MAKDLTRNYKAEIEAWDWEGLKKEAIDNACIVDDQKEGTSFLGTVFSIFPSGKYYTPYANSNVESCPKCKGKGEIKNRQYNIDKHSWFDTIEKHIRSETMLKWGEFYDKQWPKEIAFVIASLDNAINHYKQMKECPVCHGIGSLEAYQDECFQKALEEVASENDMYIFNGEGDPCDVFGGIVVEEEKEEATEIIYEM